jgi:HTH-type transcriptional regulator / antitoxin HigA
MSVWLNHIPFRLQSVANADYQAADSSEMDAESSARVGMAGALVEGDRSGSVGQPAGCSGDLSARRWSKGRKWSDCHGVQRRPNRLSIDYSDPLQQAMGVYNAVIISRGLRQTKVGNDAMKTKAKPSGTTKVSDDYLRLVQQFPLTAIRNDEHSEAAFRFIERLAIKGEDSDSNSRLTEGEAEYLETMAILIESWENSRSNRLPQVPPLQTLKFLMKEHEMSASDLGRLLGSRSLGSNILTGKRELSKDNVRTLALHFKVSTSLFI